MKNSKSIWNHPSINTTLANADYLQRRHKRLLENSTAVNKLFEYILKAETIERFKFGLSEPYIDNYDVIHSDALLAPVTNAEGEFINKTVYLNLASVTVNPLSDKSWMKGSPVSYYSHKLSDQKNILVCDSLFDLWLISQNFIFPQLEFEKDYIIISSTDEYHFPDEWYKSEFWHSFKKIILSFPGDAEGDKKASKLNEIIKEKIFRFFPPIKLGKSWNNFWQGGGTAVEFEKLLAAARPMNLKFFDHSNIENLGAGRFSYEPVDINSAFHNGYLYYAANSLVIDYDKTENFSANDFSKKRYCTETMVVRSDRSTHTVFEEPAPPGTPLDKRIIRLSDGTILDSLPAATGFATWNWHSIESYIKNHPPGVRHLKDILSDVELALRRAVWLPNKADYDLLALLVLVTYSQSIFDAVPIILVTGPPGSGKTSLGQVMAALSCNSVIAGQTTPAAVARDIHESRGLVILDDLETIGIGRKRKSQNFSAFEQVLKLSYKKDTASWNITDLKHSSRTKKFNLFGVKIINNTTGSDDILGSRMLKIFTDKIPKNQLTEFRSNYSFDKKSLKNLQNELHRWTFENVDQIAKTYKELFPSPSDRDEEIAAPLYVFASLSGDISLIKNLDRALQLKRQSSQPPSNVNELLSAAAANIGIRGFRHISSTHIALEMKALQLEFGRASPTDDFENFDTGSIGRRLRSLGIVNVSAQEKRVQHFGKTLRILPFSSGFISSLVKSDILTADTPKKNAFDFCKNCSNCRFKECDCPFMSNKLINFNS